jgi:hypothetical protein
MKYWDIFTNTIKQWWNHKYLWIVGIIAALFTGSGGGNSYSSFNNSSSSRNSTTYQQGMDSIRDFFSDPAHVTTMIIILVVLLVIGLALYVLGLYLRSRADSALYQATQKLSISDEKIGFWKTWGMGKLNLWKLVKQEILISIPIIFVVIIMLVVMSIAMSVSMPNYSTFEVSRVMFVAICFICLILIYSILVSMATVFGRRMTVLENLGEVEGLKKGFDFFIKNFSHILMFWLISLISGFVVGIVMFVVVIVLLLIGVAMVVGLMFVNPVIAIIVGIMGLLLFIVIVSLISGPTYTFNSMYWTNAYLEIKKYKEVAK